MGLTNKLGHPDLGISGRFPDSVEPISAMLITEVKKRRYVKYYAPFLSMVNESAPVDGTLEFVSVR